MALRKISVAHQSNAEETFTDEDVHLRRPFSYLETSQAKTRMFQWAPEYVNLRYTPTVWKDDLDKYRQQRGKHTIVISVVLVLILLMMAVLLKKRA